MDNMEEFEMENFESKCSRYRQHLQPLAVNDDFESNVFAKIKRKKRQRKITAAAAAGVFIAAFLLAGQLFLFQQGPDSDHDRTNVKMLATPQTRVVREEVPVLEDVVFASSDSQTSYAIDQVSYSSEGNTF